MSDRKTIFDLNSIIERCFEECKQMGYINDKKLEISTEGAISQKSPILFPQIVNQRELVRHISLTIIGELHEFEIIRRIAPIFMENRALTMDFLSFGEAFQHFYDKELQDRKMKSLRIHPEGK